MINYNNTTECLCGGWGTRVIAKTVPVPWIGTMRAKHHRVHSFSRWWFLFRCTVTSSVMNKWERRVGWMMLTRENRSTRVETSSVATLSAAVRTCTGLGAQQFARVPAWVRGSSHVYWPGSATVHTCTGLGPRQFTRVLAWIRGSSHVYWPESEAVLTCTGLDLPQFTHVLAWVLGSSHVYWPESATVHTCTGLGPQQFTRVLAWFRHSSHVYWPGMEAGPRCWQAGE